MGRGRSASSRELVNAAAHILLTVQPCSVRAVCYRLFVAGIIKSMATSETSKVSRNLVWARENGIIPWSWITDETREAERPGTWADPEAFAAAALHSFRRDRWDNQSLRVQVWSEKGTIRGTLAPVLRRYGVTLRVLHGFGSATVAREIAVEHQDRPLRVLYAGDYDPSGLYMSAVDLPERLERYGAHVHLGGLCPDARDGCDGYIDLHRVALHHRDCMNLPSFDVATKSKDPRYKWYRTHTGERRAWELDAMEPPVLRARVESDIVSCIDVPAWDRTGLAEAAEQETLRSVMSRWAGSNSVPVSE